MDEQMPLEHKITPSKIDTSFSFAEFLQPFRNLRIKYATFRTMDHYGNMDQQKKDNEKLDKQGAWKSNTDELRGVHSEFESIQTIKHRRRQQQLKDRDTKV